MLHHVIVPLDGSELAEAALPYAQALVGSSGQITLLSVLNPSEVMVETVGLAATGATVPGPIGTIPAVTLRPEENQALWEHAKTKTQNYLQLISQKVRQMGGNPTTSVQSGQPADVIVDMAEELKVDAIVMSTHGRSGLSRWLFGSITQKVLNASPCPILIIPSKSSEQAEMDHSNDG